MDACQALSKARDLRAEFDKREKPLSIVKELVGDADPEIKAFSTKFERIKNLSEFYLSKVGVDTFRNLNIHKSVTSYGA